MFVHMGNFSPVERVAIKLKHNLNGGPCKLVSFTVLKVALCTLEFLLIKLICILLSGNL